MEARGQLHASAALPLGKEPFYPLNKKLGWVGERAVLYVLGKINISWYYEDSNPAAPRP